MSSDFYNKLLAISCMLLLLGCGSCDEIDTDEDPKAIVNSKPCALLLDKSQVKSGEEVSFSMKFKKEGTPVDTIFLVNGERYPLDYLSTADLPVGKHTITGRLLMKDSSNCESYRSIEILSDIEPEIFGIEVMSSMDHDPLAYTQGLTMHMGRIYEGTGNFGESFLYSYTPGLGDYSAKVPLDMTYFGEGLTILGDRLYQLTYKAGQGFVYDLGNMERVGEFTYAGEGWGLTDDGRHLIMSDGSHTLRFIDPQTFEVVREQGVYADKGKLLNINELEYVDGVIYANIYTADHIAKIDPVSGKVLAFIDARGLLEEVHATGEEDVLNGIAYNPARGSFYLTGKLWPRMYEVRFEPRSPL